MNQNTIVNQEHNTNTFGMGDELIHHVRRHARVERRASIQRAPIAIVIVRIWCARELETRGERRDRDSRRPEGAARNTQIAERVRGRGPRAMAEAKARFSATT